MLQSSIALFLSSRTWSPWHSAGSDSFSDDVRIIRFNTFHVLNSFSPEKNLVHFQSLDFIHGSVHRLPFLLFLAHFNLLSSRVPLVERDRGLFFFFTITFVGVVSISKSVIWITSNSPLVLKLLKLPVWSSTLVLFPHQNYVTYSFFNRFFVHSRMRSSTTPDVISSVPPLQLTLTKQSILLLECR